MKRKLQKTKLMTANQVSMYYGIANKLRKFGDKIDKYAVVDNSIDQKKLTTIMHCLFNDTRLWMAKHNKIFKIK